MKKFLIILFIMYLINFIYADDFLPQNDSYFGERRTKIIWTLGSGVSSGSAYGYQEQQNGFTGDLELFRTIGRIKPENFLLKYIWLSGSIHYSLYEDDTSINEFIFQYDTIPDDVIIKITFDYHIESGNNETTKVVTWNVDQSAAENTITVGSNSTSTSSANITFTQGDTEAVLFRFEIDQTDGDADGIIRVNNIIIYTELSSASGVPNYYADDIIKDILNLVGNSEFSADYDQLASPSLALITSSSTLILISLISVLITNTYPY